MTEKQKLKIRDMRLEGLGYRSIASELNIPYSSVKSFCKRRGLVGMGPIVSMNNDVAIKLGCFLCAPSMAFSLTVKVRYVGTYQPTISEAQAIQREVEVKEVCSKILVR